MAHIFQGQEPNSGPGEGLPAAQGALSGFEVPGTEQESLDVGSKNSEEASGLIRRIDPDPEPNRRALVKRWTSLVTAAKEHWRDDFKRMRSNMDFVHGNQWPSDSESRDKYVANIVQRHLQQKVAALYAKNPKAVCKRRKTLDFAVWDENMQSLNSAMQSLQGASMGLVDPSVGMQSQSMIQDAMQGFQRRQMLDKIAKTMEILFHYYIHQQEPGFKLQVKQMIRRACTCSVAYMKVGFQRILQKRPEDVEKITDVTQRIAMLKRISADKIDEKITQDDPETEQLRILLDELRAKPDQILKEGLIFDFPASTSVIIDPRCRNIRTFIGAQWVAQEFILSKDDMKEIYNVDIGKSYTAYRPEAPAENPLRRQKEPGDKDMCVVWEIYSKTDGMLYKVCDGYPEFLEEPSAPDVQLERFWPFFSLTFNDIENERRIFPPSDVELLAPMQKEFNRSRQALREHRIANRPVYAVPNGMLDEEDVQKLQTRPNNAVVVLNALQPGQSVSEVIQAIKPAPIDPALYETNGIFDDVLKTVGGQEANMGGTNSATATQSSIAESSRSAAISSNIDDLDDLLSEMARACGQIMLANLNEETVKKIVGPGAVWPVMSAQEIADELVLEIEAGSSGRPNKAAEVANFQQLAPIIMQIPGLDPSWLLKQAIMRMDDNLDTTDALVAGLQSIVAMNSQKQMAVAAGSEQDPNAQGAEGAQNEQPRQPGAAPLPGPSQTVGGSAPMQNSASNMG
jgi:hypothetical protein